MQVEFVVSSLLVSRVFSAGTPVFLSPQRPTFLNSNSSLVDLFYLFILNILLQHIFEHFHRQPKDSHDVDFSRVRMWCLNGWYVLFCY